MDAVVNLKVFYDMRETYYLVLKIIFVLLVSSVSFQHICCAKKISTRGTIVDPVEVNVTAFYDLQKAIASVGKRRVILTISTPQTIKSSVVTPSNISLKIIDNGLITVNKGATLTICGHLDAGMHKIFDCIDTGGVKFADGTNIRSSPQWFGAKGDGSDDTIAVQKSVDAAVDGVIVIDKQYFVNGTTNATYNSYGGIKLLNNQSIIFQDKGALRLMPTGSGEYAIVRCEGVTNVKIVAPKLIGDRDGHLGSTGEWGMGIFVANSSNIKINGGIITKCWGDGIYVGQFGNNNASSDIEVLDVTIHDCRRQGISIVGGKGINISGCRIYNIRGTNPQSAIDLEPNDITYDNSDIKITGNTIYDSQIGVLIANAANKGVFISKNDIRAGRAIQYATGATDIKVTGNKLTVIPFSDETTTMPCGLMIIGSKSGGSLFFTSNTVQLASLGALTTLINSTAGKLTAEYHIIGNIFSPDVLCGTSILGIGTNSEFSDNTLSIPADFNPGSLKDRSILTFFGNGWIVKKNRFINNSHSLVMISLASGIKLSRGSLGNYFSGNMSTNNMQLKE